MSDQFFIEWRDSGKWPHCAPDPRYPDGIDVEVAKPEDACCVANLPYPAKRCGVFIVRCKVCDFSVGLTTAGRPDDPRSVKIPCRLVGSAQ